MNERIRPALAIMAAGLGQRYGELKQIVPIYNDGCRGNILMEYAIYDALVTGYSKIAILLRKDFEDEFRKKYGNRIEKGADKFGVEIKYAYQESIDDVKKILPFREKMWGTGHAALCFKDVINEPAVFINADDFYGRESYKIMYDFFNGKDYKPDGKIHSMVGFRLKNVVSHYGSVARGICTATSDGFLESITERKNICSKNGEIFDLVNDRKILLDDNSITSMNIWGFDPNIFKKLSEGFNEFYKDVSKNKKSKEEFYLSNYIGELIKKGEIEVKILPTKAQWFGMTYREDYSRVATEIEKLTARGIYPDKLWD